jgi:CRP-like cAMP-binding protein
VIATGDFGYTFSVIEDGTATVTDGDVQLAELGPGDFFGEIGLLVTGRRTASVTATSPIRVPTLFDQDFRRICSEVPAFERVLRDAMSERLGANR